MAIINDSLRPGLSVNLAFNECLTQKEEMMKQGKRILLVEDNRMVQLVTLKMLANHGHRVEVAENGFEAIQMVLATKSKDAFDLVLMDMDMPILDGLEASEELRIYGFKNPIISFSSSKIFNRISEKRLIDFELRKPFSMEAFLGVLGAIKRLEN